ncbi:MAG TPA: hypothetical protein DD400_01770 [Rhodospirillaceae bacterium]|nr:hypothetical protein [Rhodospirillaceae bacterium]
MDDPKQVEATFSEKTLLFMDELPFAFDPDTYFPKEKFSFTREDLDLPQEAKVICCGNSFVVKANEAFLSLLVRLLTKDPQAYLILMPLSGDQNVFLYHLYRAFLKEKVGLDRLRFIQPSSREKQYALLGLADLYLDCFPYSGANSLFDPLWCGVPVLCLQSEHKMRFRQGSAILQDMGLDLFVALRLEELEEKALSFLKAPPKEALGPKRVLSSSAFDGRAAKKIAQLLESL